MPEDRAEETSPEGEAGQRPEDADETSRVAADATTWGSWPRLPHPREQASEPAASDEEEGAEPTAAVPGGGGRPDGAGADPLRSALGQLERLQYELPSEAAGAADGGKLQEIVADLASSVWAIRGEVEDLPRREDVTALRTAVESVGRALRQEFREVETARDEAGGLLAARVEAALEGVRGDLGGVSAVVRKKLSEADGRRKHDHASLIKVVDDSLRNLSLRVTDLETRWQEFGDEVAAPAPASRSGESSRARSSTRCPTCGASSKATMGASLRRSSRRSSARRSQRSGTRWTGSVSASRAGASRGQRRASRRSSRT